MHFFCPACWQEISPAESICPSCGADLAVADAEPFRVKLCRALGHPEPQTAVRAAWILGERRERLAVPELIRVLETTTDSFLAEAIVEALGKIADPEALPALIGARQQGALRVRRAARLAIARISGKVSPTSEKT
jgi:HEAT repeat protein